MHVYCVHALSIDTKINDPQWPPNPGFKVTVGKIGDFGPLSRQYKQESRAVAGNPRDAAVIFDP